MPGYLCPRAQQSKQSLTRGFRGSQTWLLQWLHEQQQLWAADEGWPSPVVPRASGLNADSATTSGPWGALGGGCWEGGTVSPQTHQGSHGPPEGLLPVDKAGPGAGGREDGGPFTRSCRWLWPLKCTWNFPVLTVGCNSGRASYVYSLRSLYKARKS